MALDEVAGRIPGGGVLLLAGALAIGRGRRLAHTPYISTCLAPGKYDEDQPRK